LNKSRKKEEGRGKFGNGLCNGCNGCQEEGRGKREEGFIAFALKMRPFLIPNYEFTF